MWCEIQKPVCCGDPVLSFDSLVFDWKSNDLTPYFWSEILSFDSLVFDWGNGVYVAFVARFLGPPEFSG